MFQVGSDRALKIVCEQVIDILPVSSNRCLMTLCKAGDPEYYDIPRGCDAIYHWLLRILQKVGKDLRQCCDWWAWQYVHTGGGHKPLSTPLWGPCQPSLPNLHFSYLAISFDPHIMFHITYSLTPTLESQSQDTGCTRGQSKAVRERDMQYIGP